MGNRGSKPLSDANPPAAGADRPAAAAVASELVLDGTPVHGKRKAAGDFGDESMATLDDFTWAEGPEVDFKAILNDSPGHITPYCLDHVRRRVIFARVDPEEMGTRTFLYMDQRQTASALYAVPYALFCDIADSLAVDDAWESQVHFLQSTGRCGSTLLCKLLGQASGMVSLSEPDIYTYLGWVSVEFGDDFKGGDLLERLTKAVTWLHHTAAAGGSGKGLCIKTRSQVVVLAGVVKRAMPASKTIYLYRAPVDTIDSFCMAFATNFVMRVVRWLNIDGWFLYDVSSLDKIFPYLCPYIPAKDPRFPAEVYRGLGFVGLTALAWLFNMETAVALQQKGTFDAVLRYEDLCEQREIAVSKVLTACGHAEPVGGIADAASIFDEDAHKGNSKTASARRVNGKTPKGPLYISEADMPNLTSLLGGHKELSEIGFFIPGTLTF